MILILHDGKAFYHQFSAYLKRYGVHHLSLTLRQLTCSVTIQDKNLSIGDSTWLYEGIKIPLNEIKAILWDFYPHFSEHNPWISDEDYSYASAEWGAYLTYFFSSQNSYNMINYFLETFNRINLIKIYKELKEADIPVPEYAFSCSNHELIEGLPDSKKYILKSNIYDKTDFNASGINKNESAILAIQDTAGLPIHVIVLGKECLATAIFAHTRKKIDISDVLLKTCLKIAQLFKFKICEIFLKYLNDGTFFIYSVSAFPEWNISAYSQNELFHLLLSLLLFNNPNHTKRSFIQKHNRPEVFIPTF